MRAGTRINTGSFLEGPPPARRRPPWTKSLAARIIVSSTESLMWCLNNVAPVTQRPVQQCKVTSERHELRRLRSAASLIQNYIALLSTSGVGECVFDRAPIFVAAGHGGAPRLRERNQGSVRWTLATLPRGRPLIRLSAPSPLCGGEKALVGCLAPEGLFLAKPFPSRPFSPAPRGRRCPRRMRGLLLTHAPSPRTARL